MASGFDVCPSRVPASIAVSSCQIWSVALETGTGNVSHLSSNFILGQRCDWFNIWNLRWPDGQSYTSSTRKNAISVQ